MGVEEVHDGRSFEIFADQGRRLTVTTIQRVKETGRRSPHVYTWRAETSAVVKIYINGMECAKLSRTVHEDIPTSADLEFSASLEQLENALLF